MTKHYILRISFLLVCIAFIPACPPTSTTFKIKFINTGQAPVVAAYLVPVTENAEPASWGSNILPTTQLTDGNLKTGEYLVLGPYNKGNYWIKVAFLVDDTIVEYNNEEFNEYHLSSVGLPEEFLTWHAHRSESNGAISVGTGYTWGWEEYTNEIDVTP